LSLDAKKDVFSRCEEPIKDTFAVSLWDRRHTVGLLEMETNYFQLISEIWTTGYGASSYDILKYLLNFAKPTYIASFTVTPTDSARSSCCFSFSRFVATTACLNSTVSARCLLLYKLRQLRCVRRSIDQDSIATLVHAFISSRVLLQPSNRMSEVRDGQISESSHCSCTGYY